MEYRDGSHHKHGGSMLSTDEFLKGQPLPPPSYISHDLWHEPDEKPWLSLMLLHGVFMFVAFFVFLPAAISLRSLRHKWHTRIWVCYHVSFGIGIFSASLYNKVTPNFYEGSVHASMGYSVLVIAATLSIIDCFYPLRRMYVHIRKSSRGVSPMSLLWAAFDRSNPDSGGEYHRIAVHEDDGQDEALLAVDPREVASRSNRHHTSEAPVPAAQARAVSFSVDIERGDAETWVQRDSPHASPSSNNSDLTLNERTPMGVIHKSVPDAPVSWRHYIGLAARISFHTVEHALVPLAFATAADGLVTYTGICRATTTWGCLAHLIKGGIFWCFGLLTFARYLGAWQNLGWAWNRPTVLRALSAEMVECTVIMLYGATNTWMERFGASPGAPYATKEIQHISIAVMFWFAGLIGMALESRTLRSWLSPLRPEDGPRQDPPSFNPIPGLVIGITGFAMSAHHQETQFLVDIHRLWGTLLAAFTAMRWLTYSLLWTKSRTGRSLTSEEPSRPPTEILASFFLTCGGLVFILSMEPVGVAAMRAGHDDGMMFLNLAVSVTCLGFLWMLAVVAFHGFVKTRQARGGGSRAVRLPRRSDSL